MCVNFDKVYNNFINTLKNHCEKNKNDNDGEMKSYTTTFFYSTYYDEPKNILINAKCSEEALLLLIEYFDRQKICLFKEYFNEMLIGKWESDEKYIYNTVMEKMFDERYGYSIHQVLG